MELMEQFHIMDSRIKASICPDCHFTIVCRLRENGLCGMGNMRKEWLYNRNK
jgi:hypothetical protein